MARNLHLSDAAANAEANALAALANGGYLRIYSGSQPADANTPLSGQVLLASLRFGTPAFGSASAGVLTANAITQEIDAAASGAAAWYRVLKSDGTTVLWDGSVGTANADIVMPTVNIEQHAIVSISSLSFSVTE